MNINSGESDPTLSDAMAQLAQMEGDGQSSEGSATQAPATESANTGDRAPEATENDAQSPDSLPNPGASATEEPTTPPEQAKPEAKAGTEPPKPGQQGSKFAKDQDRRIRSWKEINEEKETTRAEAARLKSEREALVAERQKFETERQQSTQPKYQPDDYLKAAKSWDAEAEALEDSGKFDEADQKRALATNARTRAKELRDNPPAAPKTDLKQQEEFKAQQKEWWTKASQDFPATAKQGSPESNALKALIQTEPSVLQDPKGMYYAARLVTAETSAARVPTMEKELGELRAKVKELSDKLAVPGDGAAANLNKDVPFSQRNESEQESELYSMAEQMSAQGR